MSLVIFAVGDLMLSQQPITHGFGVLKTIEKKGTDYLFQDVKHLLMGSDLVIGNLETTIARNEEVGYRKQFFKAPPEVAGGLKKANFHVLSVANNHIMEHGENGFLSSVSHLRDCGVIPIGLKNGMEIIESKGKKVAIGGYSLVEDGCRNPLYNRISDEEKIFSDVERIKSIADLIVVSIHWGSEYVSLPSPDQIRLGRRLVDTGVDMILGHHPHVVQSMERYGEKLIFYSLGNFIFDQGFIDETRNSMIAKIEVGDKGALDYSLIPVVIDPDVHAPKIPSEKVSENRLKEMDRLREEIEGRMLSEYMSVEDYGNLVKKRLKAAKKKMKKQFLKNLHRYPLSTIIIITHKYLRNTLNRIRPKKAAVQ